MTDISGLDKVALLRALWENQQTAGFFVRVGSAGPSFDKSKAEDVVRNGEIDYFCGRAIKTDLSGDTADFTCYDRDASLPGAKVVAKMRDPSWTPSEREKAEASRKRQEYRDTALGATIEIIPCVATDTIPDKQLVCPSGTSFSPYGKELLPGKPGSVMCVHCGLLKRGHKIKKVAL